MIAAGQDAERQTQPEQIAATLRALDSMARAGGGRLVIAWLPAAYDEEPAPPVLATLRAMCEGMSVPFVNLRGTVPASGFCDTQHATVDGKEQTTRALALGLSSTLQQIQEGGR
jgi:hypothetical protein